MRAMAYTVPVYCSLIRCGASSSSPFEVLGEQHLILDVAFLPPHGFHPSQCGVTATV